LVPFGNYLPPQRKVPVFDCLLELGTGIAGHRLSVAGPIGSRVQCSKVIGLPPIRSLSFREILAGCAKALEG
jgi:hypothetical protein